MKNIDFESLGWVHPYKDNINLIDMLHELYNKVGCKYANNNLNLIPDSKKYVFILIDGMGYNLLKSIAPESFMAQNIKNKMNTIFPSSTGTVLTSIATGLTPNKHSINGWFSYDEEHKESLMTLPFINRFSENKPLNTKFEDVFLGEPVFRNIPISVDVINDEKIIDSKFSTWATGNRDSHGYSSIETAFDSAKDLVCKGDKSFIYMYLSEFDAICHKMGTKHKETEILLKHIDACVEKFCKETGDKCTTIITADHGLVDVDSSKYIIILPNDDMCKYFYAPPSGDTRFSSFYIKSEYKDQFVKTFDERYGQKAVLLSIEQVEELQLLGRCNLDKIAKKRFGDYIAIWLNGYAFEYRMSNEYTFKPFGNHGGLTKEEMEVPLIVI